MFKNAIRSLQLMVEAFHPEFCKEAIDFLYLEVKCLQKEKVKALAFLEGYKGDMTNPLRIIITNDVENYIKRLDIKINLAEESICELNIRMKTYELHKDILGDEDINSIKIVDHDEGRYSPAFSDNSKDSGYSSPQLRHYPRDTVALLGGEVPYFKLDESTLPTSLYGYLK